MHYIPLRGIGAQGHSNRRNINHTKQSKYHRLHGAKISINQPVSVSAGLSKKMTQENVAKIFVAPSVQ